MLYKYRDNEQKAIHRKDPYPHHQPPATTFGCPVWGNELTVPPPDGSLPGMFRTVSPLSPFQFLPLQSSGRVAGGNAKCRSMSPCVVREPGGSRLCRLLGRSGLMRARRKAIEGCSAPLAPHLHGSISATRGEQQAIGRPRHVPHRLRMPPIGQQGLASVGCPHWH